MPKIKALTLVFLVGALDNKTLAEALNHCATDEVGMLEKLTHKDLVTLTSVREGPCVSLYLPTMPERSLYEEYDILVRRALRLLHLDQKVSIAKDIEEKLLSFNPAEYLIVEEDQGICIFVNKSWAGYFVPSHEIPSKVVVSETFHLKPLLDDLKGQKIFHILAISTQEAFLLSCDGGRCTESHNFLFQFGSHSNSIHWKQGFDEETFHMPHTKVTTRGRGLIDNKGKKRTTVKIFLRWVEAKISKEPGFQSSPLMVFSSEALFQVYKEVSTHSAPSFFKLESATLPSHDQMVHKAHEALLKAIQTKERLALEEVKERAQQKVISDLLRISRAALSGKIETLFLRENSEIWGQLHKNSGDITFIERQSSSKDDDVLDDIACEVIRHGGEVIVVKDKDMPTKGAAAAILSP